MAAEPAPAAAAGAGPAKERLLEALAGAEGRGTKGLDEAQQARVGELIGELEAAGGVRAPTASGLLEGRWRLLYTTRPGTASPIQSTFTGVEAFTIYQEICLGVTDRPRVDNVVEFGAFGELRVEALASTDSRPLEGFTPREGDGRIGAWYPLGRSDVSPPSKAETRIDFKFDYAAFAFRDLAIAVPYPVPFRNPLLADETKGWLDTTYLDPGGDLRLARGNKGTTFVLVRDPSPRDELLDLLADDEAADADVAEAVDALLDAVPLGAKPDLKRNRNDVRKATGQWKLVWSEQNDQVNPLQAQLTKLKDRAFQTVDVDTVENLVKLVPGGLVNVRASAESAITSKDRIAVTIDEVVLEVGPWRLPLRGAARAQDGAGFLDILYCDDGLRVSRGSKGSLFVHTKGV